MAVPKSPDSPSYLTPIQYHQHEEEDLTIPTLKRLKADFPIGSPLDRAPTPYCIDLTFD